MNSRFAALCLTLIYVCCPRIARGQDVVAIPDALNPLASAAAENRLSEAFAERTRLLDTGSLAATKEVLQSLDESRLPVNTEADARVALLLRELRVACDSASVPAAEREAARQAAADYRALGSSGRVRWLQIHAERNPPFRHVAWTLWEEHRDSPRADFSLLDAYTATLAADDAATVVALELLRLSEADRWNSDAAAHCLDWWQAHGTSARSSWLAAILAPRLGGMPPAPAMRLLLLLQAHIPVAARFDIVTPWLTSPDPAIRAMAVAELAARMDDTMLQDARLRAQSATGLLCRGLGEILAARQDNIAVLFTSRLAAADPATRQAMLQVLASVPTVDAFDAALPWIAEMHVESAERLAQTAMLLKRVDVMPVFADAAAGNATLVAPALQVALFCVRELYVMPPPFRPIAAADFRATASLPLLPKAGAVRNDSLNPTEADLLLTVRLNAPRYVAAVDFGSWNGTTTISLRASAEGAVTRLRDGIPLGEVSNEDVNYLPLPMLSRTVAVDAVVDRIEFRIRGMTPSQLDEIRLYGIETEATMLAAALQAWAKAELPAPDQLSAWTVAAKGASSFSERLRPPPPKSWKEAIPFAAKPELSALIESMQAACPTSTRPAFLRLCMESYSLDEEATATAAAAFRLARPGSCIADFYEGYLHAILACKQTPPEAAHAVRAVELLDAAGRAAPDNLLILKAVAEVHYRTRNYPVAMAIQEQLCALSRGAELGAAQQWRGLILLRMGRFDESAACFEQGLPGHAAPQVMWYNAACALSMGGRLDDALKFLQQAYGLDRNTYTSEKFEKDSDLNNVRRHPPYLEWIQSLQQPPK